MSKARDIADLGAVTSRLDTVGASDGALSNRNLIINGAMQVAQRSTSKTGVNSNGYHTLDRWNMLIRGGAAYTMSQDSDAPSGFNNSLKLACTTADATPATNDRTFLQTSFEGQDLQRFGKGTSDAKDFVLSFWVKSTVTGTYQVNIQDDDNSRINSGSYTINTASTWEYKTVIIANETANAFDDDANRSAIFEWILSAGPTYTSGAAPSAFETFSDGDRAADQTANIAASTSDTFQITGVQLEVGDTATPFEHRSYGDELARCQRYFRQINSSSAEINLIGSGLWDNSTNARVIVHHPVEMRSAPSYSASSSSHLVVGESGVAFRTGTNTIQIYTRDGFSSLIKLDVSSSGAAVGEGALIGINSGSGYYVRFDAEL